MKKKNIIKILILVFIAILALLFMVLGAEEEGRKYSIEEVKEYNYFVLQEEGKYGIIDKNSKIIIEPKFVSVVIPNPSKAIFVCTDENNHTQIYNEQNQELFSNYEEVSSIRLKNIESDLMYEKNILKYKKGEKYGLIDYGGSEITGAIYDSINSLGYKEGELLVEQNGKYGVINIKGKTLVPVSYETIKADGYIQDNSYNDDGYIVGIKTEEGYRYGYIDVEGNEVLKTEYNELSRITDISKEDGLYLLASKNGQFGVYKKSEQIINNEYQSISYNKSNNSFVLEKSRKFGLANIGGNILIDVKYSQIDVIGKYVYAKDGSGKTEVFDSDGKMTNMSENVSKLSVADGKYSIVITSDENKTLYGIQDSQEKEVVKAQYNYIEYLFDNYFIASNSEGKLGIIDDKGNIKLDLKYGSIQEIKDTKLIQASISDENLTEIYSPEIEKIVGMNDAIITQVNDYIRIYNGKESLYINQNGQKVESKQVYKDNNLFATTKEGKWGFEDARGNVKVECKYDRVTEFNEYGFAGIEQEGKWGVIDSNMNIVVEPKYVFESNVDPYFLGSYYRVTYGFGEVYYTNK